MTASGAERKCLARLASGSYPRHENICSLRAFRRLPSRPGEFHREPLTEPDLILLHHPARAIARRLPPATERFGLLPA